MPILNYATKIDAWKTISEIQMMLSKHGATHFSIKNEGSRPIAVSFSIDFKNQPLNFLLPCKFDRLWLILQRDKKAVSVLKAKSLYSEDHAFNVSWRIIKDWIEAQLALVEVEMVKMEEVFMPYLIINTSGETLSERMLHGDGIKKLLSKN